MVRKDRALGTFCDVRYVIMANNLTPRRIDRGNWSRPRVILVALFVPVVEALRKVGFSPLPPRLQGLGRPWPLISLERFSTNGPSRNTIMKANCVQHTCRTEQLRSEPYRAARPSLPAIRLRFAEFARAGQCRAADLSLPVRDWAYSQPSPVYISSSVDRGEGPSSGSARRLAYAPFSRPLDIRRTKIATTVSEDIKHTFFGAIPGFATIQIWSTNGLLIGPPFGMPRGLFSAVFVFPETLFSLRGAARITANAVYARPPRAAGLRRPPVDQNGYGPPLGLMRAKNAERRNGILPHSVPSGFGS